MPLPRDTTGDSDELIERAIRASDYEEICCILNELIERVRTLEREKYEAVYSAWEDIQGEDL